MITNSEEAKIKVLPIEIDYKDESQSGRLHDIGIDPLLFYNGTVISIKDISSFDLKSNGMFPVLEVYFHDKLQEMHNNLMALDNTIISLYMDSRSKNSDFSSTLRPIRMDFKIVDFSYIEEEKLFYVRGVVDCDPLYLTTIRSYNQKTSFEVIKDLASYTKLGFSTNITTTNDTMNWMIPSGSILEFIKNVTRNAFKDDTSFLTSFIDYYYNINYVDVEKELKEKSADLEGLTSSNEEDLGVLIEKKVGKFYLSNKAFGQNKTNNLFDTYELINTSTKKSLKNGYRTMLHYYDLTGNWEQKAGTFVKIALETNTDGRGIILKSFPQDNKDDGFFMKNSKSLYLSELDVDNTHKHYNYASLLNNYNLEEINKVKMVLTMETPNFNLHRFQKVHVLIFESKLTLNSEKSDVLNQRLSGGWLITGINYHFNPQDGVKQEVVMIKREFTVDDFEY